MGALGVGSLPACVARARQRAERIKSHPAYTTAIGEDCRIVPPVAAPGPTQPNLTAVPQTDFAVRLTFAMRGHDQIEIQSQRAAEVAWAMLAFDTNSPYIDGRASVAAATPEQRRYRARFVDNDVPVGDWSDTVEVTARP